MMRFCKFFLFLLCFAFWGFAQSSKLDIKVVVTPVAAHCHQPGGLPIPDSLHFTIDSDFGHDGFLVESEKLDALIQSFINRKLNNLS